MANLLKIPAKRCLTAAGMLFNQSGQVLLIHHRQLDCWLCPGGHVEPGELPHQAAEREFGEETGWQVKAVDYLLSVTDPESQFLPSPIESNLHWISQENYQQRVKKILEAGDQPPTMVARSLKNGHHVHCEQHLALVYLVELVSPATDWQPAAAEIKGINWFSVSDLAATVASGIIIPTNLIIQINHGWQIFSRYQSQPLFKF